jgi:hypothetical protein
MTTDRACRLCGYIECAPDCCALPRGMRVYGRIQALAVRLLTRMNLEVSHCWLPQADWDALATWCLSMGGHVDNPEHETKAIKLCFVAGEIDVYAYDEAETAWAFRGKSEDA